MLQDSHFKVILYGSCYIMVCYVFWRWLLLCYVMSHKILFCSVLFYAVLLYCFSMYYVVFGHGGMTAPTFCFFLRVGGGWAGDDDVLFLKIRYADGCMVKAFLRLSFHIMPNCIIASPVIL